MPHSISEANSADNEAAMTVGDEMETDGAQTTEMEATKTEATNDTPDEEMTTEDAIPDQRKEIEVAKAKQEVKLEDLFADDDSDEEFPSSNQQKVKVSSSPPEAPSSPVSV